MADLISMQISRIISFIYQEVEEKEQDIDERAEGEATLLKSKIILEQKMAIERLYSKNEEKMARIYNRLTAQIRQRLFMKLMAIRWELFHQLKEDVRSNFENQKCDRPIMTKLFLEALFCLLQGNVFVRVRTQDLDTAKNIVPEIISEFTRTSGLKVNIEIMDESPLPDHVLGGVEVVSANGKILVSNTLADRIERIFRTHGPYIRDKIFGRNIRRKFYDTI